MEVHGYVAGWGTLALINAGLAQGKNRSGLNWFLISLLIGPLATFLLVAFGHRLPGGQRNGP
jgi:purine-cytosine permease-like protein